MSCLRIHPSFKLANPSRTSVRFTTLSGEAKDIYPDHGEVFLQGDERPNGKVGALDHAFGIDNYVMRFALRCDRRVGTGGLGGGYCTG